MKPARAARAELKQLRVQTALVICVAAIEPKESDQAWHLGEMPRPRPKAMMESSRALRLLRPFAAMLFEKAVDLSRTHEV